MTTQGFVATHATDAPFKRGLRAFFEYPDLGIKAATQGRVPLEAGSCMHQPPGIRQRELGHSGDVELLEVVLPADFLTEDMASVDG